MLQASINCLYLLDDPGKDKHVHNYLLKALPQRGFNPLIGYFCGNSKDSIMAGNGISAVSLGLTKRQFKHFNPITILKLHNLIKNKKISIVHCQRHRTIINASLATIGTNVSTVLYTVRATNTLRNWHRRFVFNCLCKRINKVICVSEAVKDNMLCNAPSLSPEKLITIHNGVDTDAFNIFLSRVDARKKLNLPEKGFYFGIVARLKKAKSHNILLEAFSGVAKSTPDAFLVIVGDGPLENELKKLTEDLNIMSNVFFLGRKNHEEVPEVLRTLDCFVHPSLREGLGVAILEAMASGLPVISTRVDGIIEIFNTPETIGKIVPPSNADALAKTMSKFRNMDRSRLELIGQKAKEHIEAHFSKEQMVEKTVALYKETIST